MQDIKLKGPTVINGAVRYPTEGAIPVSTDEAERQRELGNVDDETSDEDLDKLKADELRDLAKDEGVDLGQATKKADMIAAIVAHRAAAEQGE